MRRATVQPRLQWTASTDGFDANETATQHVVEPMSETPSDGSGYGRDAGADQPAVREREPICHVDRLTREQVIDEIIEINPSATADFLDDFRDPRLRLYLTRLRRSRQSRGRDAVWERPADSPAIVSRERL